jgi:hypothetical protein
MSGPEGVNHLGRAGSKCGFPLLDDGAWSGTVDRAGGGDACRRDAYGHAVLVDVARGSQKQRYHDDIIEIFS